MSFNNKNVDSKKTYSLYERPPVKECGGKLDKDGIDSYWGESLTIQSEAENANITLIMEKYSKTGIINAHIRDNLQYADLSELPDYHTAYNQIARSNELFDSLDAKIRDRFHNSPAEMLDFLSKEENIDESIKLGLVKAKEIIETKKEATTAPPQSTPKD